MYIDHNKFDCFFGIRPTSDILHLGHSMALFNMFHIILDNSEKINNVYFLLAEIHAEISTIDNEIIHYNAIKLGNQVVILFNAYLKQRGVPSKVIGEIFEKIKFIFQYDHELCHMSLTYRYFPLMKSKTLLKNPIFKNGTNSSIAFLTYPVLQAFDVFLYTQPDIPLYVFVGNDQNANINILKDISKKLKLVQENILSEVIIYDNVLYDNKSDKKMSKSLNNFVEFNNIDAIRKYVGGYLTYSRESINHAGVHEECPFYNRFANEVYRLFPNQKFHFNLCDTGEISCAECKNRVLDIFINICTDCEIPSNQIFEVGGIYSKRRVSKFFVENQYTKLLRLIDNVRSSK